MFTDSQLRHRARRHGLQILKVREDSRDFWEYGPYALIDVETNGICECGMDAEQLEAALADRAGMLTAGRER